MRKSEIKALFMARVGKYIDQDLKLIDFTVDINNETGKARIMACYYTKARHVCEKRYLDYLIEGDIFKYAGYEIL